MSRDPIKVLRSAPALVVLVKEVFTQVSLLFNFASEVVDKVEYLLLLYLFIIFIEIS